MAVKRCIIPGCDSTSNEKVMVSVPANPERRRKWLEIAGRGPSKCNTLYCCEDHFDLEADARNWRYYKYAGRFLHMKPHVVPHLALNPTQKRPETQMSDSEKKMKEEFLNSLKPSKKGKKKHGGKQKPASDEASNQPFCRSTEKRGDEQNSVSFDALIQPSCRSTVKRGDEQNSISDEDSNQPSCRSMKKCGDEQNSISDEGSNKPSCRSTVKRGDEQNSTSVEVTTRKRTRKERLSVKKESDNGSCSKSEVEENLREESRMKTSNSKGYACDVCEYRCRYAYLLPRHKAKHHSQTSELKNHNQKKPDVSRKPTYPCPVCVFEAPGRPELEDHMKEHSRTSEQPSEKTARTRTRISCGFCPYRGHSAYVLEIHRIKCHPDHNTQDNPAERRPTFPCAYCSYRGQFPHHTERHTMQCHPDRQPLRKLAGVKNLRYPCSTCSYVASGYFDLAAHREKWHSVTDESSSAKNPSGVKNLNYPCPTCKYVASGYFDLAAHREKWHSVTDETSSAKNRSGVNDVLPSDRNDSLAPSENGEQSSVKTPTGKKRFVCRICEFQTPHPHFMLAHMQASHQKVVKANKNSEPAQTYTVTDGSEIQPGLIVQEQMIVLQIPQEIHSDHVMVQIEMGDVKPVTADDSVGDPIGCDAVDVDKIGNRLIQMNASAVHFTNYELTDELNTADPLDDSIVVCNYFTGDKLGEDDANQHLEQNRAKQPV